MDAENPTPEQAHEQAPPPTGRRFRGAPDAKEAASAAMADGLAHEFGLERLMDILSDGEDRR